MAGVSDDKPPTADEADDTPPTAPPAADKPADKPEFKVQFAMVTAVVAVVVTGWLIVSGRLWDGQFGLSDESWKGLGASGQLAARLMAPVTPIGVVLIVVGAWMAVVEWRGTFKPKQPDVVTEGAAENASTVIEAVGKLRGAALLIVAGAVLLLGTAWVARSASEPTTSSSPTASTSASPTSTPSG